MIKQYQKLLSNKQLLLRYLFLLNIVCNGFWLFVHPSWMSILLLLFVSAICSVIEFAIFCIIPTRLLKAVYSTLIILLHNAVALVDSFLLVNFGKIIDMPSIDAVLLTTPKESSEFVSSFICQTSTFGIAIGCVVINLALYWASQLLSRYRRKMEWGIFATAIGAIVFMVSYAALFFIFHTSLKLSFPMHHSFSRAVLEYNNAIHEIHIDVIMDVCRSVKATARPGEPLKMVVVIGESHSIYHTSLYGYKKLTYPKLGARQKAGELIAMNQALASHDATSLAMWSIFSLDSMNNNFIKYPLFPAVFKAAGYHTFLYDNSYLKSKSNHIMTNADLSDLLYDYRNERYYTYDGQLIGTIENKNDSLALYIIHLYGQHILYRERYPQAYAKFNASEYDNKRTEDQRQVLAEYDNACLYNDAVLDSIIRIFKEDNAVVVYFSDHGEEVYDLRNKTGHASVDTASDPAYQLRVPLFVWMSSQFQQRHPDIVERLKKAIDIHIKTDDISHFLIDIAGVESSWLERNRSFLSTKTYNGWKDIQQMVSAESVNTEEGNTRI